VADAGDGARRADAGDHGVHPPPVSFQISSPVETWCTIGLAMFSNCCGMTEPGNLGEQFLGAADGAAHALFGRGQSSRAPSRTSILRRSIDMLSGMTRMIG